MANYLKVADMQRIKALLELGWSHRRIERETGVRRETIAKYAKEGISKADKVPTGSDSGKTSRNQAEPYRNLILEGLERGLTAQRIYEDLCYDSGYTGSYDSVKRLCRRLRKKHKEVVGVMHSAPGDESQIDFFSGPLTFDKEADHWKRPSIFVITLCHSRHSYEEAIFTQKIEPFIRCHEHAFKEFGGVTKVIRLDNLKAGVSRACLYDPDIAAVYEAFSRHCGFVALPCIPSNPKEKGKVERYGQYIKGALKDRRFDSLDDLNAFLRKRNRTIGSLRIHGTTKKQVLTHFLEVEKPALKPLPLENFSFFVQGGRLVHQDGHIQIKGAFYSVPHQFIGQRLTIRFDERFIKVLDGEKTVAVHVRTSPGLFVTREEHRPRHKPASQEAFLRNLFSRAERVGADAYLWARAAEAEREVRSFRLIQGMLSFCRKYPKERVNWACRIAHEAGQYRHQTLAKLLEEAESKAPQEASLTQNHELIRPLSDYQAHLDKNKKP